MPSRQAIYPVSFHLGKSVTLGHKGPVIGVITQGTWRYPKQVRLLNGQLSPVFEEGSKPERSDQLRDWIRAHA